MKKKNIRIFDINPFVSGMRFSGMGRHRKPSG